MTKIATALAASAAVLASAGAASAGPLLACDIRPENQSIGVAVTNQSHVVIGASATYVIRLTPKDRRRPMLTFVQAFPYPIKPGDIGFFYPPHLPLYRACTAQLRLPAEAIDQLRRGGRPQDRRRTPQ